MKPNYILYSNKGILLFVLNYDTYEMPFTYGNLATRLTYNRYHFTSCNMNEADYNDVENLIKVMPFDHCKRFVHCIEEFTVATDDSRTILTSNETKSLIELPEPVRKLHSTASHVEFIKDLVSNATFFVALIR